MPQITKIKIDDISLKHGLILAPMAGVTDKSFRTIAKKFGAELLVSEMISAKGLFYKDKKTNILADFSESEQPFAVQIFGSDPKIMAYAADYFQNLKKPPDMIDINMGCPMPKIVSNGDGSALMKNPALVSQVVKAVTEATSLPVSVKIRTGWDSNSINAVEIARICEQNGAKMICVHGRTKAQIYSPPIDYETIKNVKSSVSVPVIANGGIHSAEDAVYMLERTGCDGVAIAQGAMGNPWIFAQIISKLNSETPREPTLEEKLDTAKEHMLLLIKDKGEYIGIREARKHLGWYIKGLRGGASARDKINKSDSKDEILNIISSLLGNNLFDCD